MWELQRHKSKSKCIVLFGRAALHFLAIITCMFCKISAEGDGGLEPKGPRLVSPLSFAGGDPS